MTDIPVAANRNKPCPICGKPPQPKSFPFCSTRCADVDLHRWFSESYRAPIDEQPEQSEIEE